MSRFAVPSLVFLLLASASNPAQETDGRQTDGRRFLDPVKALTGHWVTESGHTHYYFGNGNLVMVDEGKPQKMTYQVLDQDNDEVVLKLKTVTESGNSHERVLRYTSTRRSLLETVWVKVGPRKLYVSTVWKFVDDKTQPEKK